jgi:hypothetical protein
MRVITATAAASPEISFPVRIGIAPSKHPTKSRNKFAVDDCNRKIVKGHYPDDMPSHPSGQQVL